MTRIPARDGAAREIAILRDFFARDATLPAHAPMRLRLMLSHPGADLVVDFSDELPDPVFHRIFSGLSFRPDTLSLKREVAFYRRIVRSGGFRSIALARDAVVPVARAADPVLFEASLRAGYGVHLHTVKASPLAQVAEKALDSGCARLLAAWIAENPEAFAAGCCDPAHLINNPKPALVLAAMPEVDRDPEILAPIYNILEGKDPAAALFGASRHQILARRMFRAAVTPEALLAMRLRDIRKIHAELQAG